MRYPWTFLPASIHCYVNRAYYRTNVFGRASRYPLYSIESADLNIESEHSISNSAAPISFSCDLVLLEDVTIGEAIMPGVMIGNLDHVVQVSTGVLVATKFDAEKQSVETLQWISRPLRQLPVLTNHVPVSSSDGQ